MADVPPFLWADAGTFDSPKTYTVPGSGEVQPYTATATYDNASGQAILPALRIKSAAGNLLALVFPAGQIADGDSSEVTFVPPFGSAASSTDAIRFNADNQGGYLDVTANASDPSLGVGILLNDQSGGGLWLQTGGLGGITMLTGAGGDVDIDASGGGNLNAEGAAVTVIANDDMSLTAGDFFTLKSSHTGGGHNAVQVQTNADDSFSHKDLTSGAILFQTTTHGVWGFLRAGGTFTLFDHNGAAILQVEEATPNYRIKAGHAWVANL